MRFVQDSGKGTHVLSTHAELSLIRTSLKSLPGTYGTPDETNLRRLPGACCILATTHEPNSKGFVWRLCVDLPSAVSQEQNLTKDQALTETLHRKHGNACVTVQEVDASYHTRDVYQIIVQHKSFE